MSDDIHFQTWICPKCHDDHRQDSPCTPKDDKPFMPAESDKSYIAIQYRILTQELEAVKAKLALAEQGFDDAIYDFERIMTADWEESQMRTCAKGGAYRAKKAIEWIKQSQGK